MPPVLTRVHRTQTNGYCGAFTYIDDWNLTNQQQGFILQKVTRHLDVTLYYDGLELPLTMDGAANKFAPMPQPLYLDVTTYWELFAVPAAGAIHGDQFQSNWFAPTTNGQPSAVTRGTFTIRGDAKFYATTANPAALGFALPYQAISAGLPSTLIDPSAHFAGIAVSSALVTRTVVASWDSRTLDQATKSRGVTHLAVA